MLGLDFFRRSTELAHAYLPEGKSLRFTIQTNGTLLDDEWCRFLKRHDFLVGISLDGPREIHDRFYDFVRTLFIETNPVPVKAALSLMGKIRNEFRLPLVPMEPKNRERLVEAMRAAGLLGLLATLPTHAAADAESWRREGREALALARTLPRGVRARNVILFVGDGMGLSTVTAAA